MNAEHDFSNEGLSPGFIYNAAIKGSLVTSQTYSFFFFFNVLLHGGVSQVSGYEFSFGGPGCWRSRGLSRQLGELSWGVGVGGGGLLSCCLTEQQIKPDGLIYGQLAVCAVDAVPHTHLELLLLAFIQAAEKAGGCRVQVLMHFWPVKTGELVLSCMISSRNAAMQEARKVHEHKLC